MVHRRSGGRVPGVRECSRTAHGESGWTGRLIPLTVDGLIYASSMAMLDSARRGARVPALAQWLLGLGITATLTANVATAWAPMRSQPMSRGIMVLLSTVARGP